MSVLKWLGKVAQSAIDPNREERVNQLEALIFNGLKQFGKNFSIRQIQLTEDFARADLSDAAERVFQNSLKRAWNDNVITANEKAQLSMLEKALELDPQKIKSMQMNFAKASFESVLAQAMEDGVVDEKEKKHLTHIAAQMGCSLGAFANAYFQNECEGFLRSIFLAAINDGDLSVQEWNNLIATIETLGLTQEEFFSKVRPQAQAFVEHVLADAKSDDCLSTAEEEQLTWLVKNLRLPDDYVRYVRKEVAKVKLLEQIEQGRLPSIEAPSGFEVVGGEIVHGQVRCDLKIVRKLKTGLKTATHQGLLVITDRKAVFVSETKSLRLNYRSIVGHRGNDELIVLQIQGKPEIVLSFGILMKLFIPSLRQPWRLPTKPKLLKLMKKNLATSAETFARRFGGGMEDVV